MDLLAQLLVQCVLDHLHILRDKQVAEERKRNLIVIVISISGSRRFAGGGGG